MHRRKVDGTLCYRRLAEKATETIKAAITETWPGERPVKAILDACNPTGATSYVNFTSSKETRWQTAQVPHQRGRLR